ncbi:hypothetical protein AAHE18_02G184900 [Arachis hypogaea]
MMMSSITLIVIEFATNPIREGNCPREGSTQSSCIQPAATESCCGMKIALPNLETSYLSILRCLATSGLCEDVICQVHLCHFGNHKPHFLQTLTSTNIKYSGVFFHPSLHDVNYLMLLRSLRLSHCHRDHMTNDEF